MQMRHISVLFMLFGSKDDLCYSTDCDVFVLKLKPKTLRLMNSHFLYRRHLVVGVTIITRSQYLPTDPLLFCFIVNMSEDGGHN